MPYTIAIKGKAVGFVVGDVFTKKVRSSVHFLHSPPSIAFDRSSILKAVKYGAKFIQIHDLDTGKEYWTSIQSLEENYFRVNRGYGEQMAMSMRYWKHTKEECNVV